MYTSKPLIHGKKDKKDWKAFSLNFVASACAEKLEGFTQN